MGCISSKIKRWKDNRNNEKRMALTMRVAAYQLWKCYVCGTFIDKPYHLAQIIQNNNINFENLQVLCQQCHARKLNRTKYTPPSYS